MDTAPNFSAFSSGVELMVFTAAVTIGALLVVIWILKTIRGSD